MGYRSGSSNTRFCLAVGCGELVRGRSSYCPAHDQIAAWSNSASTRRARGWNWSKIRKQVLKRDNYRCRVCGKLANEVDHTVPVAWGGSESLDNLQAMCSTCHRRKTEWEKNARRRSSREGIAHG